MDGQRAAAQARASPAGRNGNAVRVAQAHYLADFVGIGRAQYYVGGKVQVFGMVAAIVGVHVGGGGSFGALSSEDVHRADDGLESD